MKAGVAFVLLDPSYPSPRLQERCTLVRSNIVLCSQQHTAKAQAMSQIIIAKWGGKVRLLNAYGPAECCMLSTRQPNVSIIDPSNIGYAMGGACWVVDKADDTNQMPIGAVPELLIEGPVVGRGYFIDPEKTARHLLRIWVAIPF